MRRTDDLRPILSTTILAIAALLLSGCLSESSDEEVSSVEPPPGPTNSAPRISGNPATAVNIGDA